MKVKLKLLKNDQGFKHYFKSVNWLFFDKIISLLFTFVVGIYVARYLGPEQLGLLTYATVVVALVTAFIKLGLETIVYRELADSRILANIILGTSTLMTFLSWALFFIFYLLFAYDKSLESLLVIVLLAGNILIPFNLLSRYFLSKQKSKYLAIPGLIASISSAILKITLVIIEADLYFFAIAVVVENTLKYFLFLYFYNKEKDKARWSVSYKVAKDFLISSWPYVVISLATTVYTKIDIVMVKHLLGNESAGHYTIAMRLSEIYLFIPNIISNVLFVAVINALNKSITLAKERVQALYSFYFILSIVIAVFMFLISDFLVFFLFGEQFIEAAEILQVYIWAIIFIFLQSAQNLYFSAISFQKLTMARVLFGALINIVLNYIFIIYFGVIGAAYATVVTYFITSIILNILSFKTRDNFWLLTKAIINPWHSLKALSFVKT